MAKLGRLILTGQPLIEKWLAFGSAVLLAATMLLTSGDVLMRYIFRKPIAGAYELTGFFILVLVCLSFAYVQGKGQHLALDFLPKKLSGKPRAALAILALLVGLAFFGTIVYRGSLSALDSIMMKEFSPGIVRFPVYPVRILLALGAALMCIRLILDIIRQFASLLGLSPAK